MFIQSYRTGAAPARGLQSFFVDFSALGNANPLSQGGIWIKPTPALFNNGMQVNGGKVYDGGTATGTNDACAALVLYPSWGRRTQIETTVFNDGSVGASEIEHHHRETYSAVPGSEFLDLYEALTLAGGPLGVKWLGNQTFVFLTQTGGPGDWMGSIPPQTGDRIISKVFDDNVNTLTMEIYQFQLSSGNTTLRFRGVDDGTLSGGGPMYTTGVVGMGADNGGADNGSLAWTTFQATEF